MTVADCNSKILGLGGCGFAVRKALNDRDEGVLQKHLSDCMEPTWQRDSTPEIRTSKLARFSITAKPSTSHHQP